MEMTYCLRRRDQDEVGGDVNARGVDDKSVGGNAGDGGANLWAGNTLQQCRLWLLAPKKRIIMEEAFLLYCMAALKRQ
jgi:hypothetical protein